MLRTKLLVLLTIVVAALWFAPRAVADSGAYLVCHQRSNGAVVLLSVGSLNAVIPHFFGHGDVAEWDLITAEEVIAACSGGD